MGECMLCGGQTSETGTCKSCGLENNLSNKNKKGYELIFSDNTIYTPSHQKNLDLKEYITKNKDDITESIKEFKEKIKESETKYKNDLLLFGDKISNKFLSELPENAILSRIGYLEILKKPNKEYEANVQKIDNEIKKCLMEIEKRTMNQDKNKIVSDMLIDWDETQNKFSKEPIAWTMNYQKSKLLRPRFNADKRK
jgi:hypothetical protein